MTHVVPLPGRGCRYWHDGRCLYAALLNPGLERDVLCVVMRALEIRFDEHVTRSERFGLSEDQAGRIWKDRVRRCLEGDWDCSEYRPSVDEDGESLCVHLFGEVCLRLVPPCPGRCRHFQVAK